jgi:hypothetical protein
MQPEPDSSPSKSGLDLVAFGPPTCVLMRTRLIFDGVAAVRAARIKYFVR